MVTHERKNAGNETKVEAIEKIIIKQQETTCWLYFSKKIMW